MHSELHGKACLRRERERKKETWKASIPGKQTQFGNVIIDEYISQPMFL